MRPLGEIIIHCSATRPEWMRLEPLHAKINEIRRWHKARGWRDVGYHYIIDRNGDIGIGRPLGYTGAHTLGHNTGTVGICLLGGHGSSADDKFFDNFTDAQDASLRELIADLKRDFPTISKVSGHNQYATKACPGFRVPRWIIDKPATPEPKKRKRVTGPFSLLMASIVAMIGGRK